MFEFIVIVLTLVLIGCLFFKSDGSPTTRKHTRRRRKYSDEYWTGLPWMGGEKKKKKDFWDD